MYKYTFAKFTCMEMAVGVAYIYGLRGTSVRQCGRVARVANVYCSHTYIHTYICIYIHLYRSMVL